MGSIRRKASVRHLTVEIALPGEVDDGEKDAKLVAEGIKTEDGGALFAGPWPHLEEVECGCCALSLRPGGPALPDLARLQIRLTGYSWACRSRPGAQWLVSGLRRVLEAGANFVATFDFRSYPPDAAFVQGLAAFCEEQREHWAARLKAVVLLIEDNFFTSAAEGHPIGAFLEACVPSCPFAVCHGEAAAEEFFRAAALATAPVASCAARLFVSVVDVLEVPHRVVDRGGCATPVKGGSSPCGAAAAASCLAKLGPLRAAGKGAYSQEHTFHMLPNGDVRVIQSPPLDVIHMLRAGSDPTPHEGKPAATDAIKSSAGTVSGSDLAAMAALKFDCPRDRLRGLVGAHFHVGELVIDAEVESAMRGRAVGGVEGLSINILYKDSLGPCFAGIYTLLCWILERVRACIEPSDLCH